MAGKYKNQFFRLREHREKNGKVGKISQSYPIFTFLHEKLAKLKSQVVTPDFTIKDYFLSGVRCYQLILNQILFRLNAKSGGNI
jgi:hypothetical protein